MLLGYVAYPKNLILICLKTSLRLYHLWLSHLLLMKVVIVEVNLALSPRQTGVRETKSNLKSDASLALTLIPTKYHVNVQRWLSDRLQFTSCNPFFDNPESLLEHDELLCEKQRTYQICHTGVSCTYIPPNLVFTGSA